MHKVTIEPLMETIEVRDDQTLLDAALRRGIWIPYVCAHGLCGRCKVDVLEGEVDHGEASEFALLDVEREEGKALACVARAKSDLVIEAETEEDEDTPQIELRDFVGRVVAKEKVTPTILLLSIDIGPETIEFLPGQFVQLDIPGLVQPRAFSIATPASVSNRIELHIRRVPDGKGTAYIWDDLDVGSEIKFSGPYGRFFVRKSRSQPILFLAGGVGMSSIESMVLDLAERNDLYADREIVLIHGSRDESEVYHRERFEAIAKAHPKFRYIPTIDPSDAISDTWQGETGFVHDVADNVFGGKFAGWNAYLCGPPKMIDACLSTLMRGRLFEKNIFLEQFYSNENRDDDKSSSPLFRRF